MFCVSLFSFSCFVPCSTCSGYTAIHLAHILVYVYCYIGNMEIRFLSEKIYSARIRSHCEFSVVCRFIREEFHSSDVKTTTILTIYNFTKQVKSKRRPPPPPTPPPRKTPIWWKERKIVYFLNNSASTYWQDSLMQYNTDRDSSLP